ncbi:radical SAM protein, partial [bacterium]|nr:radical SAM protein [bacterium]
PLTTTELDHVHALDYERDQHPYYEDQGRVRALDTIRFSLTTHRGCFGGCSFCSIGLHQGRAIVSRSEESILEEARLLTRHREFRGVIADVGGPTANMYGFACSRKKDPFACRDRSCLSPAPCPNLRADHRSQINLLRKLRQLPGVRHVFVASGIRHDLVMADRRSGRAYLEELVSHHISGQMKIAPEHISPQVLWLMNKPGNDSLLAFKDLFYEINRTCGKKQFLTYYLIAGHPGCTLGDMEDLKRFATVELRTNPEQVQIFTPLPSTWSGVMYSTETDPADGSKIFVEKDPYRRQEQKDVLTEKTRIGKQRRKG